MDDPTARWVRLDTERAFREAFADKRFAGEGFQFTIHADGRLTGQFGAARLDGRWHWRDGYFCRTASLDGEDLGLDCEIIEYRPGEMRYTRDKGAGERTVVAFG
ncbi:MAG TPA: hypothetical protein DIU07_16015 [Rhodobacteraceae bacterium]|nr:hypothetical protein [Paracoccaceae bacterium]